MLQHLLACALLALATLLTVALPLASCEAAGRAKVAPRGTSAA